MCFNWLPTELLQGSTTTDNDFIESCYQVFRQDFIDSTPIFPNREVWMKRHPTAPDGREATFWHMTTIENEQSNREEDRERCLDRCSKIPWPKPIIEAYSNNTLKVWSEPRGSKTRIHLALPDFSYIVVLCDRGQKIIPWTAYIVEYGSNKRNLERRYNRNKDQ